MRNVIEVVFAVASVFGMMTPTATAFLSPIRHRTATAHDATKLSDMDVMCLENVAELCAELDEESCDVEDHEAILNQLEAQMKEFHNHNIHLEAFEHLKHMDEAKESQQEA